MQRGQQEDNILASLDGPSTPSSAAAAAAQANDAAAAPAATEPPAASGSRRRAAAAGGALWQDAAGSGARTTAVDLPSYINDCIIHRSVTVSTRR